MRRFLPSVLAAVMLLLAMACKSAPLPDGLQAVSSPPSVILPDGWAVQVDLATTPEQQARGLMFVENLPQDRGMLFLFDTDEQRSFWMKNCFISLDLVWLDESFTVVDITRDAPPCKEDPCPNFLPSRPIRNVLELPAGVTTSHHLSVGDRLVVVNLPVKSPPPGGGVP
ncbi:MAG: hypothetical protein B7X11_01180 [Acidobacteria bacterium 37-65-4]|nr:MAG: hypothetical protein B7X11_01180 [Acidobacteria bacterium 37-65-4]